jgi:hypothetical protein
MSLLGIQFFIFRLKSDGEMQEYLRSASDAAFDGFELEAAEKAALKSGDLAGLFEMGVHPLLLAPYSRAMGIPRPRHQELLAPVKGTRMLRSAAPGFGGEEG